MHHLPAGQKVPGQPGSRSYEDRHIKEENPTAEELRTWWKRSGLPLKKFFNTSGLQYKALGLKDKLPGMTEEEQLALLATDGMLVKRPILVGEDFVLVGFREDEWEALKSITQVPEGSAKFSANFPRGQPPNAKKQAGLRQLERLEGVSTVGAVTFPGHNERGGRQTVPPAFCLKGGVEAWNRSFPNQKRGPGYGAAAAGGGGLFWA